MKSYIESGILELYVLDLLDHDERADVMQMLSTYPELRIEHELIQRNFENFANVNRIEPPAPLRDTIIDSILNLQKEKEMMPTDLPVINQHSDYKNWLRFVGDLSSVALDEGKFERVLRFDEKVLQVLVVSETDIDEEIHEDEEESFLILAGQCRCRIGDVVTFMKPGDFMDIPLDELHDITLVTKQVVAILQRVKI